MIVTADDVATTSPEVENDLISILNASKPSVDLSDAIVLLTVPVLLLIANEPLIAASEKSEAETTPDVCRIVQ